MELLMCSSFATEYSKQLSVLDSGNKRLGAVSDLIIMLNGTCVLPQLLVDGG
jgi:hypothetical protein